MVELPGISLAFGQVEIEPTFPIELHKNFKSKKCVNRFMYIVIIWSVRDSKKVEEIQQTIFTGEIREFDKPYPNYNLILFS